MDTRALLFDGHRDWLDATLASTRTIINPHPVTLADGTTVTPLATGVMLVEPAAGSLRTMDTGLILSAGIHGDETAPIELLSQCVDDLLSNHLQAGCTSLLILANPPAMAAAVRFAQHNLNRLFNGAHQQADVAGSAEADRALALEGLCRNFSERFARVAHYDMHTAIRPSQRETFALYPYVPGRRVPATQLAFLAGAGIQALVLQHGPANTFAAFSSQTLNAESFTLELGQVKPFGENDLQRFSGLNNALRALIGGERVHGRESEQKTPLTLFEVVEEVINTGPGFRFHVPDDAPNFTEFGPGTLIWEDGEKNYLTGPGPECVIFPNPQVPVGHRVALMIRPVDTVT